MRAVRPSSRRRPSQVLRAAIESCEPRRLLASVTGTVFADADRSGTRNGSEAGLSGETVYGDLNYNGTKDAHEPSATTNASGFYSLPIPTGPSSVAIRLLGVPKSQITAPAAGYHSGKFASAYTASNRNFGVAPAVPTTTTISGVIFNDLNGNGKRDAGEPTGSSSLGISQVYADLNGDGTRQDNEVGYVDYTTGAYTLTGAPVGRTFALQYVAEYGGEIDNGWWYQSAPASIGYEKPLLVTTTAAPVTNANFGFTRAGTIGGYAVIDANGNGKADADETFVSRGYWLDLDNDHVRDAGEFAIPSGYPATDGRPPMGPYALAVPFGTYTVAYGKNIAVGAVAEGFTTVTLSAAHPGATALVAVPPTQAAVSGIAFEDANNNGVRDAGERPLLNAVVFADYNNNGVLDADDDATATQNYPYTDDAMYYLPVDAGRAFTLRIVAGEYGQPVRTTQTYAIGALTGTQQAYGRNFANPSATTTITGTLFNDLNANGKRDAGEPGDRENRFGAYEVYADLNRNGFLDDGEPASTIREDASTYTLTGVPIGQTVDIRYVADFGSPLLEGRIFQTAPFGYGYDVPLKVATTAAPVTGADLGFARLATLRQASVIDANGNGKADADEHLAPGTTWLDVDNDHIHDANEPGLPAVYRDNGSHGGPNALEHIFLPVPYATFTVAYAPSATVGAVATAFARVTTSAANPDLVVRLATPPTGPAVSGVAFEDANGNGVRDANEGRISGATVFADYNNNGVRDADDDWTSVDYYADDASYYLPVDAGRAFTLRIATGGDNGSGAVGTQVRTKQTYAIAGLTGTQQALRNFANPPQQFATVTGTVFADADRSGTRNNGEAGLAGRTVFADLNYNGIKEANEPAALTDASGFYSLAVPTGANSVAIRLLGVPTSQITAPAGGAHSAKFTTAYVASNRNFGVAPTP